MKNGIFNPFKSPAVLSICPGILGLERGVEQATGKLRVAAFIEIEAVLIANLLAGMESGVLDPSVIWTDVKTFNPKPFHRKIHGILAGYNCQPFSLAGKREGVDDPRHLWPAIRNIIESIEPFWIYCENVDDHLSLGFDTVYKDLRALGYAVEAGVYTAEEVGAPHERKRLFIFALANSYKMAARGRYADLLIPGKAHERESWLKNRQWGGNGSVISSKELGNSKSDNKRNDREIRQRRKEQDRRPGNELESAADQRICEPCICEGGSAQFIQSEKLAYSTGAGQPKLRHNGKPSKKNNTGACYPSSELGHSEGFRHERYSVKTGNIESQDRREYEGSRIVGTDTAARTRYPATQGFFQYDWEAPRVIEPRLVSSIAGYNFREDILRAIGNSVVADCAEVAFIDLLVKHLK